MKQSSKLSDMAVSPVVGVMLMLVVTIVVAALVSTFAGGLGSSADASPTIMLKGELSATNGLVLTSVGVTSGKPIAFDVYIGEGSGAYKVTEGSMTAGNTESFTPGSILTATPENLNKSFVDAFGAFDGYKGTGMYIGTDTPHIGSVFCIALATKSGNPVGKTYVTLTP